MPEQKETRYTPWTIEPGTFEVCINCKTVDNQIGGVLLRRRVIGRDGETHTEYKVQCPNCQQSTDVHRHKLISIKEWAGKQQPKDTLPHRNKKKGAQEAWIAAATSRK